MQINDLAAGNLKAIYTIKLPRRRDENGKQIPALLEPKNFFGLCPFSETHGMRYVESLYKHPLEGKGHTQDQILAYQATKARIENARIRKDNRAYTLAQEYLTRRKDYDKTVCTCIDVVGNFIPKTKYEFDQVSRNSLDVLKDIERKAHLESISWEAVLNYITTF